MSEPRPGPAHIVGAGPGVGASLARRLARAGHRVGLVARNRARLEDLARELALDGVEAKTCPADARDPAAVTAALQELARHQGPPEVMCFSPLPDISLIKPVLQTTPADLDAALALNVVGAAAAAAAVLPAMRAAGRGTLLFVTGGAVQHPSAERAASAVAGFAEKAYVELLAEALAGTPLRVAHLVVVGAIGSGQKHEPDAVAERLWGLHTDSAQPYAVLS